MHAVVVSLTTPPLLAFCACFCHGRAAVAAGQGLCFWPGRAHCCDKSDPCCTGARYAALRSRPLSSGPQSVPYGIRVSEEVQEALHTGKPVRSLSLSSLSLCVSPSLPLPPLCVVVYAVYVDSAHSPVCTYHIHAAHVDHAYERTNTRVDSRPHATRTRERKCQHRLFGRL